MTTGAFWPKQLIQGPDQERGRGRIQGQQDKEAEGNQILHMRLPNAKGICSSSALLEQFHRGACEMRAAGGH